MLSSLFRHGYKFYDWVTGYHVLRCFNEMMRTQWLSADEMRALQLRRMQSLLEYAYTYVPYYQRIFNEVNFQPANLVKNPESFKRIPPVSKTYIHEHADEFLTTDPARRKHAYRSATSGSTGHPFVFWEDRHCEEYSIASILRHHTWSGWKMGQPRIYIYGSTPREKQSLKSSVQENIENYIWKCSFASAYGLSEEKMTGLANLTRKRKPQLIHSYPAALYFFAQFVRRKGWDDIKVPAVYTSGEILFPHQRKYFEETFGCEVFNKYASSEVSAIACECEKHTAMHINTETNYVEILDDNNKPVNNGTTGNVVVTCLTNYVFPFIRYRLEDLACMSSQRCCCGRGQPMLDVVEGRLVDAFKTKDGKMVWGECLNIFSREKIKQWQMIQKSLDLILVRLVVTDTFQKFRLDVFERRIKAALGEETRVKFELLDSIPVKPGGKYRYIISEVPNPNPQKEIY